MAGACGMLQLFDDTLSFATAEASGELCAQSDFPKPHCNPGSRLPNRLSMSVFVPFRIFRRLFDHLVDHIPRSYFEAKLDAYLFGQSDEAIGRAIERVHYYHRGERRFPAWHRELADWPRPSCSYRDDFRPYRRYFAPQSKISYQMGPGSLAGDCPMLVKSRSIHSVSDKTVLFKFDAEKLYPRIRDARRFAEKTPLAANAGQNRDCVHHQNGGDQRSDRCSDPAMDISSSCYLRKPSLSRRQLLEFRYILFHQNVACSCNPKWIMSSQSLCVMPQPAHETWLMEGCLRPNYHYVAVKQDLSDLVEKVVYYNDHPLEAEDIIHNANVYAGRFDDEPSERLIGFLVLIKYLFLSGQIEISERMKSFVCDEPRCGAFW